MTTLTNAITLPMSDKSLPETKNLKVDETAYQRLVHRAIDEVVRCLLVTEAPSGLTIEKVQDRVRVFAACSTEPWARATDAVQHKPGGQRASSDVLKTEYYRLVRTLRDHLTGTLLSEEREVWERARKRIIAQAEYGIFRVTESTVHLHRLTPNKECNRYG
jgi:hypothetical protein